MNRFVQIPEGKLESPEQGRAYSEEFSINMKSHIEGRLKSGDKLTLVKTFATNGCILFIVDLSPLEETNIEQVFSL